MAGGGRVGVSGATKGARGAAKGASAPVADDLESRRRAFFAAATERFRASQPRHDEQDCDYEVIDLTLDSSQGSVRLDDTGVDDADVRPSPGDAFVIDLAGD